ncbi:hypothetical protein F441_03643 [Phytophthora nicotianae CJ01A1]|nr:hypothetical protein F443_03650 [Phytophthora nicotianae P1569]ETK93234.1 hypothetical protein L915_03544 [Phytophthora nicotianae]ETM52932.1 hypothetical protein L914_03519 [Phytophthora nicotianae]ETP23175.1 hypothetical protein F441_03643 [Phytophthora nicotianae CJ01A1]
MRVWSEASQTNQVVLAATIAQYFYAELPPQHHFRVPFNFNALSSADCVSKFRFGKAQIESLVSLFALDAIRTRERTAANGVEGLCIVLYKLAIPLRWKDLESFFGRTESGLSNLFLHVLDHLESKFADLLYFNHEYAANHVQTYADAVFDAGGSMQNVWAFVDGTVRGICRPKARNSQRDGKYRSQKSVYNGHKRKHALRYQTLSTPDGLITHVYGPFPGRNHDIKLFKDSRIANVIRGDARFKPYRIYGDQAYGNDSVLSSPFTGAVANLSREQKLVNKSMSKVRVSVEWGYGQVVNYWTALDLKRQARSGTQPVGSMYRVAILLTNCLTCANGGNTISDYFRLPPPSLEEYLKGS